MSNTKYVFLWVCSGHRDNCMGKAGEALGSFLALDCEWMRRNPQEPESQCIQRDSAHGKGDWEGTLFPHTSAQAVKQLLFYSWTFCIHQELPWSLYY